MLRHGPGSGRLRPAQASLVRLMVAAAGWLSVMSVTGSAQADEPAILADLHAFMRSETTDARAALVRRIAADPAYDPTKVRNWLHALDLFQSFKPGGRRIDVRITPNIERLVRLRIPKNYDPRKPWPLIVAYHGGGDKAHRFIRTVEWLLGDRIENFVVAAPHDYRETVVDLPGPPTGEQPTVWQAVKRVVHVDSDRMYVLGHSLGGYTAWTAAIFYPDRFAAAVPFGSAYSIPAEGHLWETFFPNSEHIRILHVWGERDGLNVPGFGGRRASNTITGLNRVFVEKARKAELKIVFHPIPGAAHNEGVTAPAFLNDFLTHKREHYPPTIDHTFRYLHQASAYWLEGHTWLGERWDAAFHQRTIDELNAVRGAAEPTWIVDALRDRLGQLRGSIDKQVISVQRRHIGEITVWIRPDLLHQPEPITLIVDGRKVFEGRLQPDLQVCLAQAARTFDFDRLRWAGLRVDASGKVSVVTGATPFPRTIPR